MIPYADFLYFGVLLLVAVPTVLLSYSGWGFRPWLLIVTVAMLAMQYGGLLHIGPATEMREVWMVAGFALFEWAVAQGFLSLRARTRSRWLFYSALLLSMLPLVVAKYVLPVATSGIQFGFVGISYVTFRAIDTIICAQDGLISTLPPGQLFVYLFFFGTISSGPIDRYRRFQRDWQHRRTRAEVVDDLDGAMRRIFTGFLYKFLVAALVKKYWLDPAAAQSGFWPLISYMYAYSFYLFFDFAGYSAFAVGVSYLFGIHTPENFNRPFLARNIREFWNRWHITLSWWLRDHVYTRFLMASAKGRWLRSRDLAAHLGFFLTFGLMGLWHGLAPHYLIYGLYHGVLRSGYELFARWKKRRGYLGDGPLPRAVGVFATFQCVCFGFLLFSGRLTQASDTQRTQPRDTSHYEGAYEKADCEEIGGWAWDAGHRDAPVSVDVIVDGTLLATVRADLFRPDLAAAGKGTGAHAFLYVVPPQLKDGWLHQIAVRISGSDQSLSEAPKPIVCAMNVKALDGYAGALESTDCRIVSGWAWDAMRPDTPIAVDLYDGDRLIDTVTADQLRAELRDGGYGNGKHGFTYMLPAEIRDEQPHSLSVRIGGSNVALAQSPQVVTCPRSPPAAHDRSTETNRIASPRGEVPPDASANRPASDTAGMLGTPAVSPSYTDNRDGTIRANHTGLIWEKKVALDGVADAKNLHDADNCYPWQGSCAAGGSACLVNADCGTNGPCQAVDCQTAAAGGLTIFSWLEQLNATAFAGHTDWRLPSSHELYTLSDPLEENEAAATAAFSGAGCGSECRRLDDPACSCTVDMHKGLYWAVPEQAPRPDESWMMLFFCHGNLFLDLKTNKFFVRAVRGG